MRKFLSLALAATLVLASCSKDDDGPKTSGPDPDPSADVTAQNFMWKAMNIWYFWQGDVPNLADDRFANTTEYTDFLKSESDPEQFFYKICNKHENLVGSANAIDRFSFLEENYQDLVKSFAGITKSNGLEFGLYQFSNSDNVFGYVKYIVPNSSASGTDIARGDLFVGVNGQTLNINNYYDLLFGSGSDSYTLNMAEINSNDEIAPNGEEVSLSKVENLVEDPVFIHKVLTIDGHKIAYLMYNQFTSNYDEELNNVFGEFKAAGATDLVLDLRYNPGGDVNSARLLSSMIHGTNTSEVFIRQRWNDKLQSEFDEEDLVDYFADKTKKSGGTAINTLNLNKVYVITTGGTASASELVINGLAPYMDVVQIGTKTVGKNEFSITLVDLPSNSYIYNEGQSNKINPKDQWGIQPLVGRNENAAGFSDYTSGLLPDIVLAEDLSNFGFLGEPSEPLLKKAISEITGTTAKADFKVNFPAKEFTNSKMHTPLKDNMYLSKPIHLDL